MLVMLLFDKMSVGYMLAANAYGKKIVVYELVLGLILVSALPLSYFCFVNGLTPYSLSACLAATMFANAIGRVAYCRWQLRMSIIHWVKSVVFPVLSVSIVGYALACYVRSMFVPSACRVMLVSLISLVFVSSLGWFVVLSRDERRFIARFADKIKKRIVK